MKMKKLVGAGIAFAMLVMGSASVQAFSCDECYCGYYGQVFGGVNFMSDAELDYNSTKTDAEFDAGYVVGGAIGHQWNNGFAGEFEISFRDNDLDKETTSGTTGDARGDYSAWAFMANGYYRWHNDCLCMDVIPYVGAGVGGAYVSADWKSPAAIVTDDDDWVFAYQGIVGLSYCFCDEWDLFGEYRYFGTTSPEFAHASYNISSEYSSHSVVMGVRFAIQ